MTETSYDYASMTAEAASKLAQLEGRVLLRCLVQIVPPEFNVAYLALDVGIWCIQGRIGGEVLEIFTIEEIPVDGREEISIKAFEPFSMFLNRRIVQARSIGSVWNGHGFEFSFEGLPDRTMIVQSIYTGDKADGFEDCLRLGMGYYFHDTSAVSWSGV
jgi:hypothetical protein